MMVLNYTEDETVLLKIFPNEVWTLISKAVVGRATYQNVSSASPVLHALLIPRRVHALFLDVMDILVQQNKKDIDTRWNQTLLSKLTHNLDELLSRPTRLPQPETPIHVLSLRLVSRSWNAGVINLLEKNVTESFLSGNPVQIPGVDKKKLRKVLRDTKDINKFENHVYTDILASNTKPQILPGLIFEVSPAMISKCINLLQKHAEHVWLFELYPFGEYSAIEFCNIVKRILSILPNLKLFACRAPHAEEHDHHRSAKLEANMAQKTFPTLPKLINARLVGMPFDFITGLLQNNRHIKTLCTGFLPQLEMVDMWKKIPGNTELGLKLQTKQEFKAFKNSKIFLSIEKLYLNVSKVQNLSHEKVFQAVEFKYASSLIALSLYLPDTQLPCVSHKLFLPNLKVLLLSTPQPIPHEILLPLSESLEQLYIETGSYNQKSRKAFEYSTIEENPKDSSAWVSFPRLQILGLHEVGGRPWSKCTREEWRTAESKSVRTTLSS